MDIGHDSTGKKLDKKKQTVIAVAAVVAVVIAYITLKRMSSGSSASTGTGTTGTGAGGTATGGQSPDSTGMQYQLDTLAGMIANLKGQAPASSTPTVGIPENHTRYGRPTVKIPEKNQPSGPTLRDYVGKTLKVGISSAHGAKGATIGEILQNYGMTFEQYKSVNVLRAGATVNDKIATGTDVNIIGNASNLANQNVLNYNGLGGLGNALHQTASTPQTLRYNATAVPKPSTPATHG
jgi:hypothetical protein